jgi:hypothetical protein
MTRSFSPGLRLFRICAAILCLLLSGQARAAANAGGGAGSPAAPDTTGGHPMVLRVYSDYV